MENGEGNVRHLGMQLCVYVLQAGLRCWWQVHPYNLPLSCLQFPPLKASCNRVAIKVGR